MTRVLALGAELAAEGYPRAGALVAAARAGGCEVMELEVSVPASGRERKALVTAPWRWPAFALGMLRAKRRAQEQIARAAASFAPDVVLVLYPGHLLVRWARAVWPGRLALDFFLSAHDTVVLDRKLWGQRSPVAAWLRRLDRRACESADLVLLDTAAHGDRVASLVGLPRERFAVVPVGDARAPDPAPAYRAPAPGERLEVLFFGTGIPLHGLPVLLDAVERTPGIRLTLVGGSDADRARAKRLPAERCVVHERFVGRARLEELLHRTHLVAGIFDRGLKASLVVPLKVMHGLAFGRPVVTADTPAIRSLLSPGHDCLVVAPGDPAALSGLLAGLVREPSRLPGLARRARERFDATFSVAATGAALGALLHGLAGEPRRAERTLEAAAR